VRHGFWTFVLLLMSAVVCISAIPQSDLPETSYNEIDIPVNQAPPVVSGVRFVRPTLATVILSKQVGKVSRGDASQGLKRKSDHTHVRRDPHSLQDLLCTFLI
jgi:hypothetical protein